MITPHPVSHVTCDVSDVTCHMQNYRESQWYVCYQRGLPRLVYVCVKAKAKIMLNQFKILFSKTHALAAMSVSLSDVPFSLNLFQGPSLALRSHDQFDLEKYKLVGVVCNSLGKESLT